MASIFTKIITREIPAYIVAEDDKHIAFLDIFPNAKGHVLAVPKKEVDKLFDLSEKDYIDLMKFARKIAKAQEKVFVDVKRIGMAVVGLEVPHVHIHLIPLKKMEDINFNKKIKLSTEEFQEIQKTIKDAIDTL